METERKRVPLDTVRPYWRNPRKITDEATDAVRQSIEEFGYVQPIVVDTDMVIIIGHTRYSALRRMGLDSIDVLVADLTQTQAKQLRLIDNKTHEYSKWDYDKLEEELADWDEDAVMRSLFDGAFADDNEMAFTAIEADQAKSEESNVAEFICPSCFHEWETEVTREQVEAGRIETE